jgi:hypothetical protein
MEIIIQKSDSTLIDGTKADGFTIAFINRTNKKSTQESDFFANGSEIAQKVNQLKRLLKTYFDAQAV